MKHDDSNLYGAVLKTISWGGLDTPPEVADVLAFVVSAQASPVAGAKSRPRALVRDHRELAR